MVEVGRVVVVDLGFFAGKRGEFLDDLRRRVMRVPIDPYGHGWTPLMKMSSFEYRGRASGVKRLVAVGWAFVRLSTAARSPLNLLWASSGDVRQLAWT